MRIAVVGGGAVGLCCARGLATRGAKVMLFERGLCGAASSTMTGGGIRQQFGTATNLDLSRLSAPFWADFAGQFGVDPHFRAIGYLFLARDPAKAAALAATVAFQRDHGLDSDYLDGAAIARRRPALAGRGFTGAGFRQADGWANQHRILDGLGRGALAAGVAIESGVEVLALGPHGVQTTLGNHEADAVVLASGAWLDLLAPLGLALPVTGRRHELLIVEPGTPLPAGLPWLIGVDDEVHLRPDAPGRALVGGFLGQDDAVPRDDLEARAQPAWRDAVLAMAGRAFGVVDGAATVRHGWAGLYPSTPDHHPIIDRLGPWLYAALGFSGTGLMHAPAAGTLIAELVLDGAIRSTDPAPLAAARFDRATVAERSGF